MHLIFRKKLSSSASGKIRSKSWSINTVSSVSVGKNTISRSYILRQYLLTIV
jgi:hypothetical protein